MKNLRNGNHYTGLTNDINRRFGEHNQGKSQVTKSNKPWILIHVEITKDRDTARKLEKYFKTGYGREITREIESNLIN